MAASVDVVVVVVNYNSGELLQRCLAALERQTYPSFRVVVVDNASADASLAGIRERYPVVQVLAQAENLGFAAGNNVGIAAAGACKWIACLNPDAFPEPDWLAELMQAAERHADFAFFGSKLILAKSPDRLDGTGDIYHVSGLAWRRDFGKRLEEGATVGDEIFAPCAAAALYRRDILDEVGGFDPSYFCYHEDVDLGFRLRLRGYRCRYVPEAQVLHVSSAIAGFRSDFSVYHGHRNMVWNYFKNMPAPLFWLYLPQHLLMNLSSLLVFGLRGQGRAILRAKWHALRGLPDVLRARRAIQAGRKAAAIDIWRQMRKGVFAPYRKA